MPRKGSEKTRTGCITCKARRVKCDEARPACQRCIKAGHTCRGYAKPADGSFSWTYLLQTSYASAARTTPSRPLQNKSLVLNPEDGRSLDFYRHVVAPALCGPLDGKFWDSTVLRGVYHDEAAKHAIIAISVLFEKFDPSWKTIKQSEETVGDRDSLALKHYNHSLRLVAMGKGEKDITMVSLASVLYVCIEFLRGNHAAAVQHCRHGILVANAARGNVGDELASRLRHMTLFPYFFGTDMSDFPTLSTDAIQGRGLQMRSTMQGLAGLLDGFMGSTVRLIRSMDAWRLGWVNVLPEHALETQKNVLESLEGWYTDYVAVMHKHAKTRSPDDEVTARHMESRYLVCWIWTHMACSRDETGYDVFHDQFRRIVHLATLEQQAGQGANSATFGFSMGFSPLLHFVVIKCRYLTVRLQAQELLRQRGWIRETLWDGFNMYAIGRRILMWEYKLDEGADISLEGMQHLVDHVPPAEDRLLDSYLEEEVIEDVDEKGLEVYKRRFHFFVREGERTREVLDWVYLPRN